MENKPLMFLDFETRSEVDLKKCGSYEYVRGVHFAPLCMAYTINDHPEVSLWTPDKPFPLELMKGCTLLPLNAEFEYNVLKSDWFKWHDYDMDWLSYDNFIDVQALAAIFGFPIMLDKLAKALNVPHQKHKSGTALINKLSIVKNNKVVTPEMEPQKFLEMYEYCRQDVRSTRDCYNMMVKKELSPMEHKVFCHMMEQNQAGLPIDVDSVHTILRVLESYKDRMNKRLARITNGEITKGTQVQRIARYIRRKYPDTDSIAADIIKEMLEMGVDKETEEILQIRQAVSHSSTAKFQRMLDRLGPDQRIRGNLKYYGGHTGRFAGVGFQMHNLPRAQHDNPEIVISDFERFAVEELIVMYGNLGAAASKLVRPMIMAPDGKMLMVVDYKSIENVMLHWVAGDTQTTEDFRNDLDQYRTYAARRFNVGYDEVTSAQRTYAKPCVLGLGYGGGKGALQRVAGNYGVELSEDEAERDKKFYRATFPMIPRLWYTVQDYMFSATQREHSLKLDTGTATFWFIKRGTYTFILLPSGRFLSYPAPQIQYVDDRKYFTYMGIDSYTKQWRRLGDQFRYVKGEHVPDMAIHGGRLVENIIQALARDILVYGMLQARDAGFNCIGSVHDEAIAEIDESDAGISLEPFTDALCTMPPWAEGVPVRGEGYIAKRYRKD